MQVPWRWESAWTRGTDSDFGVLSKDEFGPEKHNGRDTTRRKFHGPSPSVPRPRPVLLAAVLAFVRRAHDIDGVLRIALLGSLTTEKAVPKDADLLVGLERGTDLGRLARARRQLQGAAGQINLGADIFLTDQDGDYLGRVCHYRQCHPRALCQARHCGRRDHLNDDLHVVTLSPKLIAAPPVELWPRVVRRCDVPADVEELLLAELTEDSGTRTTP
jgi:predicted nucleotidyltransferase